LSAERYLDSLRDSVVSLDFEAVTETAKQAMASGIDPNLAVNEGLIPGMAIVGEKFEAGEYYLSELLVSAEVMKEALKVITPYLKSQGETRVGRVVIASVAGDLHDLGKNIVTTLLRLRGF
jgi:5-methyltetrahydrofolate--homocysteine methyltransferase